MIDKPLPAAPAWAAFDRKIPLVGVDPDDDSDTAIVCFNSAWLPYVLGALGALTRAEIWDTDDFDARNLEALRGDHLLCMFMDQCEGGGGVPTILRLAEGNCGIDWSIDNGENWSNLNLTACIADIVTTGILDSLQNGIIGPGRGIPGPGDRPAYAECTTVHVRMTANDVYILNVPVANGDTIEIKNASGTWTTIDNVVFWQCLDGRLFLLNSCEGDPIDGGPADLYPDLHHMTLVVNDLEEHADAMAGVYTVIGGDSPHLLSFEANGNQSKLFYVGFAEFDIEVCRYQGSYIHTFDFSNGQDHGWEATPGSQSILDSTGWNAIEHFSIRLELPTGSASSTLNWFGYHADQYENSGMRIGVYTDACQFYHDFPPQGAQWTDLCMIDGTYLVLSRDNPAGVRITTLEIRGNGSDPFYYQRQ